MSVPTYWLWTNTDRTILVRQWTNGDMEVSLRPQPGDIWGPPIPLNPDNTRPTREVGQ
jgi:hypothetical protein